MRRLVRTMRRAALALALLLVGLSVIGFAGYNTAWAGYYDNVEAWNAGLKQNPDRKYAIAYVGLALCGTFFMWTVVRSSKRSIVKSGED